MRGDQDYVLSFGSLDFSPLAQGGSFRYFVTGLTRGQPSPVVTAVTSLLQNGSLERVDRYENRDLTLLIGVEGDDAAAMSAGEAALFLEAQKERNTLSWRPSGGAGATTVFRILWASLAGSDADDWDLRELQGERFYTLTLRAEPFARSAVERTVTAVPSAAAPTTLDPGTTTTNWSGTGSTLTPTTSNGRSALLVTKVSGSADSDFVQWSGPYPSQAYIGLDIYGSGRNVALRVNGNQSSPVSVEPSSPGANWFRHWFSRPVGSSPLQFVISRTPSQETLLSNLVGAAGIGAASLLAIPVEGSAPTDGRIVLSRPGAPMAWATVFTDPAMAMGAYHPATQATWANAPEGTYALWMEPRSGSVVEVTVTDAQGSSQTAVLRNPSLPVWMPVGEFTFGGRADGKVGALTLSVVIDGVTVPAPTAPRLFRRSVETSLNCIIVDPTLSSGATTITIESPSVRYPLGALFADGAPVGRRFRSWEDPVLASPATYAFIEGRDSTAQPITSTATFVPAWHTNAAS